MCCWPWSAGGRCPTSGTASAQTWAPLGRCFWPLVDENLVGHEIGLDGALHDLVVGRKAVVDGAQRGPDPVLPQELLQHAPEVLN